MDECFDCNTGKIYYTVYNNSIPAKPHRHYNSKKIACKIAQHAHSGKIKRNTNHWMKNDILYLITGGV